MNVTLEQVKTLVDCNDMVCDVVRPACFICPINTPTSSWKFLVKALAEEILSSQSLLNEAAGIIDHARKYGIDRGPCSCDDCTKADMFLSKVKGTKNEGADS